MSYIVEFDYEKCVGCGACVVACLDQKDIDLSVNKPLRRLRVSEWKRLDKVSINYLSIACMHCENPPCAEVCPRGCFKRDEKNGLTLFDNKRCIGCHKCENACPYSAISYDIDNKLQKCDGCVDRLKAGLKPACERSCPQGAIVYRDRNEYKSLQELRKLKNRNKKFSFKIRGSKEL